jgi:nucleoside phosphorylase
MQRPIFLHFLNREAADAVGWKPSEKELISVLNILAINHCSRMNVNISQMLEFVSDKPKVMSKLLELFAGDILLTTSSSNNIVDFIQSRRRLYSRTPERYPMYFGSDSLAEKFSISQNNMFSMTVNLRSDILNVSPDQFFLVAKRARRDDIVKFVANIDAFQRVIYKEDDAPITKGTIAKIVNSGTLSSDALDAGGRIFSALYNEHYAVKNSNSTCTGVCNLGFEDDLSDFPHYDIPILGSINKTLGWSKIGRDAASLRRDIICEYGNEIHRRYVNCIHAFLLSCAAQVSHELSKSSDIRAIHTERQSVINLANSLLDNCGYEKTSPSSIIEYFHLSISWMYKAAYFANEKYQTFRTQWMICMPPKHKLKLLLLTATDIEDEELHAALKRSGFNQEQARSFGKGFSHYFSRGSILEIYHVRTSAGSLGANSAGFASSEAIQAFEPAYVISVGICFGLKEESQKLCDILVSEIIVDYETVRQGKELRERGQRIPAGPTLLSAAYTVKTNYNGEEVPAIHVGPIVSGQKLVDSRALVINLNKRFPDAIGGEMEGVGIMASAQRNTTEWIVVKAICDWGYDKEKDHQRPAARNSSTFVLSMIELIANAKKEVPPLKS